MSEIQTQKEIIYAFIDSQNLNLSIRDQGWRLDFAKFRIYLSDKFKIKKAHLFLGYVHSNQKLYQYLKEAGYFLIFKPTIKFKDKKTKGNIDAELVLHSMIEYENYNKAVIISNDGDFYCLIKHLRSKNKLFKVIISNKNNFSSLLKKFRKHMFYMNDLRQKLEIKDE
ncbi:NYN domain-containing protein [Candidatus Gracilibacteria bacterium]|jgi:uncharacterized LabA/DUF88 family protein|nr:NYN domain-containing protein [Candidatus Gracilibacteria bacterium]